jgi:Asp-tRNA(Asn)/Glu-tRNA(Gln) amidotransferase A subunit family amidase
MSSIPGIAEAAKLIAAKSLSPVELTQACLGRVAAMDGVLHAFVLPTPERAIADAKAAEAAIMKDEGEDARHSHRPEGHRRHGRHRHHLPVQNPG